MKRILWIFLLSGLALMVVGCRQQSQAVLPSAANVEMTLSVAPMPPTTGPATLVVSLRDAEGQPINNATVRVEGDMSHAGMEPVIREGSTGVQGDYSIPFEWTMGGDWFVTVTATLPDGTLVEQQFDYSVATNGGGMETMGEGDMDVMGASSDDEDSE